MAFRYPSKVLAQAARGGSFNAILEKREHTPLPEEVESKVHKIWEEINTYDPGIPDTALLLTHGGNCVQIDDQTIRVDCGPSSRKYLRGTTHEDVASIEDGRYVRRGISMLCVMTTRDDCLFMGVRKPKITYPLQRHHIAGRLEVKENDPLTGMYAECLQEAGLQQEEVIDLRCIGLVADLVAQSNSFEFVFRASTELTARELMAQALKAKSADEHIMFEAFPWDPDFVRENVLLPEPDGFPATGFSGLVVGLRHDFGADVFPDWEPTPMSYKDFMGRRGVMLGIK